MTHSPQTQLFPYADLSLTLTEQGNGQPVLLLHGGGGPASMRGLLEQLSAKYRVFAPTHPGWDDTPRPAWFTGVHRLADLYLNFLDDLDLKEVTVIGNSFGGWLAAELALGDRGHRIRHLILIDAVGIDAPGHQINLPPPGAALPAAGERTEPRGGPPPGTIEALLAYTGPEIRDAQLLHRLGRVRAATLVLWGENDTLVTPAYGQILANAIPGARFELIRDAGHVPMREQLQATVEAIETFVAAP